LNLYAQEKRKKEGAQKKEGGEGSLSSIGKHNGQGLRLEEKGRGG